jgi:hypothetical protein
MEMVDRHFQDTWSPDSWRKRVAQQQPEYEALDL